MELQTIITNLQPSELLSDECDSSAPNRKYDLVQDETRSQSSLSNTQDREFRASDDDVSMDGQSDEFLAESQPSIDDTEEFRSSTLSHKSEF